ncbi:MAG: hypothetical protein ABIN55_01785 [Aeromicrobium sp.]
MNVYFDVALAMLQTAIPFAAAGAAGVILFRGFIGPKVGRR